MSISCPADRVHLWLQILVYPMKREEFDRRFPKVPEAERRVLMYEAATLSVLPAKSAEMGKEKGEMPLPENESVAPDRERSPNEIREGAF